MKLNYYFLFVLSGILSQPVFAQKWVEDMQKSDANLYQIQEDFNQYWSTRDITEKGKGYKVFKRMEAFAAPRVYPSGDLGLLSQTAKNFEEFRKTYELSNNRSGKSLGSNNNLIASATFTPMGPFGALAGVATNGLSRKSGRLNFITIDPTNLSTLWVGAPAGGLWKSINGGTSWTTTTDQLTVIGCSDLAIDPTNTSIMYLATGDGDAGDTRSIGVLKSIDGGVTWNPTGLAVSVTINLLIRRLIINPSNPQILLAGTNNGIYRTIDGGVSWSVVSTANTFDLEFKPGDPTVVYAGGNNFRMSTNSGASFTQITNGLASGYQRLGIAVTPADPSYVYLLGSDPSTSGFLGLYRSVVGGTAFVAMSTSAQINLLGWNSNGGDVGGQGWFDLCIAASPLNKDEIVTGGVNCWKSVNGGTNWTLNGHWTASGAPYIHSDHHDLEYASDGTLYSTNDGTVYRRTPTTWQEICGLMNISQIYKIGLSGVTPNKWITGHQDNGTNIYTGTAYTARLAGDGMDCFFDRTNDQNIFGETPNGGLQRSVNGGTNWATCTSGLTGSAPWVTVWKQDPQNATTLYCGLSNLFRSTNLAATAWTQLTALPGGGTINEFAIAPSNNQVIYVLKNAGIYKTINGGTSWTTVTSGVPVGSAAPTFITIHPSDPNTAWVTLSGYSAGNKVYMTTNGGTSWTNYSSNLPNLPANCSVMDPGNTGMLYVGMDVGIYYRNSSSTQWTLYNAGLPNTPVSDLEISTANPGFLYAATYGRGVWVASTFAATVVPVSLYNAPTNGLCAAAAVTFTDMSTNTPIAWSWSVSPSAGVTFNSATLQNPAITFPSSGTYTVYLTATNAVGQGNTYNQVITIVNPPALTVAPLTPTAVCRNSPVSYSASGASTYTWSNGAGSATSATFFPVGLTVFSLSGTSNSCTVVQTTTAMGYPLPVVSISGPAVACEGDEITLVGNGASTYTWSNSFVGSNNVLTPGATSNYSVSGTDANGCSSTAFFGLTLDVCAGISKSGIVKSGSFAIFPNPVKSKLTITSEEEINNVSAEIFDAGGKLILSQSLSFKGSQQAAEINLGHLSAGVYLVKLTPSSGAAQTMRLVKD